MTKSKQKAEVVMGGRFEVAFVVMMYGENRIKLNRFDSWQKDV